VKYIITDQRENRRKQRAATVEWTLAGVLFLIVAVAVAKIFHVF
jgi:predicted nucleic acid-binding Zn ribbon protein